MPDNKTLCTLSKYLIDKIGQKDRKFFDTDLVRFLNDILRGYSTNCFMTIFDESMQNFRSLIWSNLEEKDPPYGEYVKTESFQQYIKNVLRTSERSDELPDICRSRSFPGRQPR